VHHQAALLNGFYTLIAKSDLIILVVSSSLLVIALFRWDQNTSNVNTSTVLANTQASAPAATVGSDSVAAESVPNAPSIGQDINTPLNAANEPLDVTASTSDVASELEPTALENDQTLQVHVVRSGDSLSEIAVRYDTSTQELRDLNGISGSTIFIGQEILYPISQ